MYCILPATTDVVSHCNKMQQALASLKTCGFDWQVWKEAISVCLELTEVWRAIELLQKSMSDDMNWNDSTIHVQTLCKHWYKCKKNISKS